MKDITVPAWAEEPVALVAAKGNYAVMAGKGQATRMRVAPGAAELAAADAEALLAPLS
ncbi:hypothetical protein O7632_22970 [Solwaraspora sp. WMMD406]|uniref:hypothetical protein n=1 Tax=Solwaraspora sp. WMMD406 TaxID=3016095 RepID=UPI002415C4A7|nr:hypothetical protein [Solwaraspora sp. WMMD406]MDG4766940.1 hypothetical protein [Solwaraspora sp. WMMD406]